LLEKIGDEYLNDKWIYKWGTSGFKVVKHISNSLVTLKLPPSSGTLVSLGSISFSFGFYQTLFGYIFSFELKLD
jgi:hypothetical protein